MREEKADEKQEDEEEKEKKKLKPKNITSGILVATQTKTCFSDESTFRNSSTIKKIKK